jgi:hypothetical protein
LLKLFVARGVQKATSGDPDQLASMRSPEELRRGGSIQRSLAELSPHSEAQRRLQERTIQIAGEGLAMQELALLQAAGSTPMPLLITLVPRPASFSLTSASAASNSQLWPGRI